MTNDTKQYCSLDELCESREGHYQECVVSERARDALDASRKLRHKQFNDLSGKLLVALGDHAAMQQTLADLNEKAKQFLDLRREIDDLIVRSASEDVRIPLMGALSGVEPFGMELDTELLAARTLLEAQKEAAS